MANRQYADPMKTRFSRDKILQTYFDVVTFSHPDYPGDPRSDISGFRAVAQRAKDAIDAEIPAKLRAIYATAKEAKAQLDAIAAKKEAEVWSWNAQLLVIAEAKLRARIASGELNENGDPKS